MLRCPGGRNHESQEQAQSIDEACKVIVLLEQLTETTAARADESAAIAEELSAQGRTLLVAKWRGQPRSDPSGRSPCPGQPGIRHNPDCRTSDLPGPLTLGSETDTKHRTPDGGSLWFRQLSKPGADLLDA